MRFTAVSLATLLLVAAVSPAQGASISIVNPSFEANNNPWPGNGPITGWTGGSGVNPATGPAACCGSQPFSPGDGSSPPGGGDLPAPDGHQWAYIQEAGTLSQSLSGFVVNQQYTLTYYDAHRLGDNGPGDTLTSQINGVDLLTTTPSNTAWNARTTTFIATATTMVLSFDHRNVTADQTVTIDGVAITGPTGTVPEPASLTLLGLGIAGFAGRSFARRQRA